jgi:hypothetical protein
LKISKYNNLVTPPNIITIQGQIILGTTYQNEDKIIIIPKRTTLPQKTFPGYSLSISLDQLKNAHSIDVNV